MKQTLATVTEIDYACTLQECADALGITRGGAYMLQKSALQKLRRHPLVFIYLREMAVELERNRASSQDSFAHWLS